MRRGIALVGLALLLVIGGILAFTSPPRLLSLYDWAAGGGDGAHQVAQGVPFGSHGQTLDIWAPAGAPAGKLPVVIFWYGGGWAKGDRAAYAFAGRALANEGFLVVIPDYRKVPQVRFPAFLEDGAEAVAWTHDNITAHGGDPQPIAFMGHSAGAYVAVMLALDTQWLTAAGVDPAITKAAVGLSGPYDFYPFDKPRSIAAMGQWPRPVETQPIEYARKDAPPLLLATSEGDTTVRPKNANNLAAKLRDLGAPVTVENYGPLDHEEVVMALSRPYRAKGPVLADSVAFLRAHLAVGGK
ncbi:MAG: alpha/beta hydrolase [Alphaproteobacteria bacterium HGW-Alphaproteobacteria-14]|nr:MAG: alpha/beta hydrolase [Alphaproteobacteria bacterium HGW-Alphaproteobacteria-14]